MTNTSCTKYLSFYFKAISAKGKVAMREKRAQGETMHLAPLGWLNARDCEGRSVLVPDPVKYALVMKARKMRAEGVSIRKICASMERNGLRSSRGKVIGPSSMLKVLAKRKHTKLKAVAQRIQTTTKDQ